MFTNLSNTADVIDIRDIIARLEEFEGDQEAAKVDVAETPAIDTWAEENPDDAAELVTLASLLSDLKGYGGDEQWRGDWYPITLIRESYFTEYCQDLVSDIGDMPREMPSYLVIDWEATADNLRVDYSTVEYGDQTYLYR